MTIDVFNVIGLGLFQMFFIPFLLLIIFNYILNILYDN